MDDNEPSWLKGDSTTDAPSGTSVPPTTLDDEPSRAWVDESTALINKETRERIEKAKKRKAGLRKGGGVEGEGGLKTSGDGGAYGGGDDDVDLLAGGDGEEDEDEEEGDEEMGVSRARRGRRRGQRPSRDGLHSAFIATQVVAILTNVALLASTVLTLVYNSPALTVVQIAVRVYMSIGALCLSVVELEWVGGGFLESWVGRGLVYGFLGVLNEETLNDGVKVAESTIVGAGAVDVFCHVTSYVLLAVGGCYAMMGIMCCRGRRERKREVYAVRLKKWEAREAGRREREGRVKKKAGGTKSWLPAWASGS